MCMASKSTSTLSSPAVIVLKAILVCLMLWYMRRLNSSCLVHCKHSYLQQYCMISVKKGLKGCKSKTLPAAPQDISTTENKS